MTNAQISFKHIVFALSIIISTGIVANAQIIGEEFFNDVENILSENVSDGLVNYSKIKTDHRLPKLINRISTADLSNSDANTKQAFYINAYNLIVIYQISSDYPIKSVQEINGFFSSKTFTVANKQMTLNDLEKEELLNSYHDPRFHFVLVCGATGCPPITSFAYRPDLLDSQLGKQTSLALNNKDFIRSSGEKVELSEIFKWYVKDFGGNKSEVIKFINNYKDKPIPSSAKISYYNYDWSLNDSYVKSGDGQSSNESTNDSRYIVSSTIAKGTVELKLFNNLYSQQTGNQENLTNRSSFFTSSLSAMYGLSNRFNIGFSTRFRKVRNNSLPSSPFSVFGGDDDESIRSGITAFGPQIRFAPVAKWLNFSIQSSFVLPLGEDLAGNSDKPYIDWDGATWNTQFFNDFFYW